MSNLIRKLYEDHFLEIEPLLTKESKRLKLSPNELVVLKTLFQMLKKRVFSIKQIEKKIELPITDIEKAVDKLTNKGFVTFALETRNEKQVEVFDLSGTFDLISKLYEEDLRQIEIQKHESKISMAIEMIENALGRVLSGAELEIVKSWYEENTHTHELIISKIEEHQTSGRFSVKFLDRILNQTKLQLAPSDEKTEEAIDRIFKAIK
ncbi:DnaD domain protein [Acholeplasma hippikon]|nr:DnaD domain protein [Acholeplasma hippikon]